jgi:hypothetical protein
MRTASAPSETDFLRTLLYYGDGEERQRLLRKVSRATREERWSWRGMWLMVTVAAGYFYALSQAPLEDLAALVGDSTVLVDLAETLGVGLLFSVVVFMGHWLWQRGFLHRVEDESRRFVLGLLESSSKTREPRLPMFYEETFGTGRRAALAVR